MAAMWERADVSVCDAEWQQLFRVVGYLPGTGIQTTITHGLRAGVAQASGEETAGNASAGVPGANAMGIRAAA